MTNLSFVPLSLHLSDSTTDYGWVSDFLCLPFNPGFPGSPGGPTFSFPCCPVGVNKSFTPLSLCRFLLLLYFIRNWNKLPLLERTLTNWGTITSKKNQFKKWPTQPLNNILCNLSYVAVKWVNAWNEQQWTLGTTAPVNNHKLSRKNLFYWSAE